MVAKLLRLRPLQLLLRKLACPCRPTWMPLRLTLPLRLATLLLPRLPTLPLLRLAKPRLLRLRNFDPRIAGRRRI